MGEYQNPRNPREAAIQAAAAVEAALSARRRAIARLRANPAQPKPTHPGRHSDSAPFGDGLDGAGMAQVRALRMLRGSASLPVRSLPDSAWSVASPPARR